MCEHIEKIVRACQGAGGIRSIFLTPESNFSGQSQIGPNTNEIIWSDPEKVVAFGFRRRNARVRKSSESSVHGASVTNTLEFSILRARIEVEKFLSTWTGKRLHAYVVQNSGFGRYIFSAKLSFTSDTGLVKSDPDEYIVRMTAEETYGTASFAGVLSIDTGEEEESSSVDPETSCYPVVNHMPISYVPSESGNQNNRNQIVTAIDGTIWFIDKNGNALRFTRTSGDIEITNPQSGLILNAPGAPFAARWKARVNNPGDLFTQKQ